MLNYKYNLYQICKSTLNWKLNMKKTNKQKETKIKVSENVYYLATCT